MRNFEKELQFIEESLQEFKDKKVLLVDMFDQKKQVKNFDSLKNVVLVKEVPRKGPNFFYDGKSSDIVMTRYHFDVQTEHETFPVTLELTDIEHQKTVNKDVIRHFMFVLDTPQMNEQNTEQLAGKLLAFLEENRSKWEWDVFHVLHHYKPFYSFKAFSELERKRFLKQWADKKANPRELMELHGRTPSPTDTSMAKKPKERFLKEVTSIEKEIADLTVRKEVLTQISTKKNVCDFVELKSITPIKLKHWYCWYYLDFNNDEVINRDYFEVETEHETFVIGLESLGTKQQVVYQPIQFSHILYQLHTPQMNQHNTEQLEKTSKMQ